MGTSDHRSEVAGAVGSVRRPVSRRDVLIGGAATMLLVGCGSSGSDDAAGTTTTTAASTDAPTSSTDGSATSTTGVIAPPTTAPDTACTLTPELTAGPFHLDGHLAREDITEGRPGTPLRFEVRVLALPDCTPLEGAAVDIWHCDAGGEYSGFDGTGTSAPGGGGRNDERFLRGVQLTENQGVARFTTIFPGWYEGRTVHIHLEVSEGGTLGTTYEGGHVAHVGQAFFGEELTAELMAAEPYAARTGRRTTNDQDSIYQQAGAGSITEMTRRSDTDPDAGYVGSLTCMIDPQAAPSAARMP